MYMEEQDGLDASLSQCLLLKAEWIPAGLHHKLTGAVWVSLPIKPLCLALTPSLLTHTIAASLEMLRKGEGDLLDKIASAPACSSHLCTTAQKYAWMSLSNVCSPARLLARSLSLPLGKTKPVLRSQGPNVLISYSSVPVLPLPPAPLSHTSVRCLS